MRRESFIDVGAVDDSPWTECRRISCPKGGGTTSDKEGNPGRLLE